MARTLAPTQAKRDVDPFVALLVYHGDRMERGRGH